LSLRHKPDLGKEECSLSRIALASVEAWNAKHADQPTVLIKTPPDRDRFALFAFLRNTSKRLSPYDIDFLELRYYPIPGLNAFNPILDFEVHALPG
jgi:hypothetical protein